MLLALLAIEIRILVVMVVSNFIRTIIRFRNFAPGNIDVIIRECFAFDDIVNCLIRGCRIFACLRAIRTISIIRDSRQVIVTHVVALQLELVRDIFIIALIRVSKLCIILVCRNLNVVCDLRSIFRDGFDAREANGKSRRICFAADILRAVICLRDGCKRRRQIRRRDFANALQHARLIIGELVRRVLLINDIVRLCGIAVQFDGIIDVLRRDGVRARHISDILVLECARALVRRTIL